MAEIGECDREIARTVLLNLDGDVRTPQDLEAFRIATERFASALAETRDAGRKETHDLLRRIIWSWEHGLGGFQARLQEAKALLAKASGET